MLDAQVEDTASKLKELCEQLDKEGNSQNQQRLERHIRMLDTRKSELLARCRELNCKPLQEGVLSREAKEERSDIQPFIKREEA